MKNRRKEKEKKQEKERQNENRKDKKEINSGTKPTSPDFSESCFFLAACNASEELLRFMSMPSVIFCFELKPYQ
jgi:hypothetical protein